MSVKFTLSDEDCHWIAAPVVKLASVIVEEPLTQRPAGTAEAVPPTLVGSTFSVSGGELVLPLKLTSLAYTAVIERAPVESEEVVKVATPEPLTATVPSVDVPSLKATFPVGVPVEEGEVSVTVAVKVTDEPWQISLADVARAVAVLALEMVKAVELVPA